MANVSPPVPNKAGDIAIITATPKSGPSSTATQNLVKQIRAAAKQAQSRYHVTVLVTGTTAINIDTSSKLSAALPVFLVLVVGLALLIQSLVFPSLLVPITAVVGFLLTIGAALGATTFAFQLGHGQQILGIASIGFSLAFGVLADAFLIRMTFVPAVHTLLGDRAWHLPRWIDRFLPNVDIEGKHLPHQLGDRSAVKPTEA